MQMNKRGYRYVGAKGTCKSCESEFELEKEDKIIYIASFDSWSCACSICGAGVTFKKDKPIEHLELKKETIYGHNSFDPMPQCSGFYE